MGNYSKLIGSIIGGILTILASLALIPEEWASPNNINTLVGAVGTIVAFGSAVFVYFFPPNKKE